MVVLGLDDVYTGVRDCANFCVYSESSAIQSLKREKAEGGGERRGEEEEG